MTIRAFLSLTLRVKNISFVGQIFHRNGKTKSWDYLKSEYNLENKLKYRWIQLADASPKLWRERILNCLGDSMNLCIFDHHLIKKKKNLYCLNKLGSRELYKIQISEKYVKPTCSCTMKDISTNLISTGSRRGYSISKRLVKLTRFQCYLLQVSGYQDIAPLLFVLRRQL